MKRKEFFAFILRHKDVVVLIFAAIIAKLFGFLRGAVLASYFGVNAYADEINLLIYPTELILSFVVNNTIITALVSFFAKKRESEDSAFWGVVHFYEVILTALALVLGLIMIFLYKDLNPLAIFIAVFTAVLYGLSGIIQSYLNYRMLFVSSSLQDAISQVILTVGIVFAALWGHPLFIILLPVSGIVRILIQLPALIKVIPFGEKYKSLFAFWSFKLDKDLLSFVLPLLVAFFVTNIPSFLVYYIFNSIGEGYISAYNYALKVTALFNPLFVIPLTTYMIPFLQRQKKAGDYKEKTLRVFLLIAIFICSVIFAILVYLFSQQVIQILYMRGHFSFDALSQTSLILRSLSFTIPGYAVMYVLLQLVIYEDRNRYVLWSNIAGSIVAVVLFLLFQREVLWIGLGLTAGTWISIAILSLGLFSSKAQVAKNERILK